MSCSGVCSRGNSSIKKNKRIIRNKEGDEEVVNEDRKKRIRIGKRVREVDEEEERKEQDRLRIRRI